MRHAARLLRSQALLPAAVRVGASDITGAGADSREFTFKVGGETYKLWAWKGDYVNLGAGAEIGIYKQGGMGDFQWDAKPELAMPMELKLIVASTGEQIYDYKPSENQWWITGFDPQHQNVGARDLTAIYTVDFSSHPELWEGFVEEYGKKGTVWEFDTGFRATYTWKGE
jgi:hypothetical protein